MDLQERVVRAVSEGASCRAAAVRYGVSLSSGIRLVRAAARSLLFGPGPLGGDQRSARVEAHAALILQVLERTPDLTLGELRAGLAASGMIAGIATLWRFLDWHGITLKKDGSRGGAEPPGRAAAAPRQVLGPARPRSRVLGRY